MEPGLPGRRPQRRGQRVPARLDRRLGRPGQLHRRRSSASPAPDWGVNWTPRVRRSTTDLTRRVRSPTSQARARCTRPSTRRSWTSCPGVPYVHTEPYPRPSRRASQGYVPSPVSLEHDGAGQPDEGLVTDRCCASSSDDSCSADPDPAGVVAPALRVGARAPRRARRGPPGGAGHAGADRRPSRHSWAGPPALRAVLLVRMSGWSTSTSANSIADQAHGPVRDGTPVPGHDRAGRSSALVFAVGHRHPARLPGRAPLRDLAGQHVGHRLAARRSRSRCSSSPTC